MVERKQRLDTLAVVTLIGCCFLWGLAQVAAKVALVEVPALWQSALRSSGGALLVFGWARRRSIPIFDRDGSLPGGLAAGLLFAVEFACIFIGLQFTTASRMALFIYIAPFVVAAGMPFIARVERLSVWQWTGLAVGFGGVVLALADGLAAPAAGPRQWVGDVLGVVAGVCWGATTLTIRATRLATAVAEKTLLYQLAVSGVALALAAAVARTPLPTALSALTIASLVFQTVIVAFASYLVWFWLVRHYPATRISAFTLLTPVFGLMLGALLLAEPVTPRLAVALAAVAAGIWIVNRR
jgi:drug/metabolite transporter (DMT)-like permease